MSKKIVFCLALIVLCLASLPALADIEGYYDYYVDDMIGGAVLTGYSGSEAHVTVPDTLGGYPLRSVSFGSFSSNASIVSVTLPDSVQYMDGGAFAGCSGLTTVYLPENLIKFFNSGDSGFNYLVDKDSATAKLMINAAGEFPGYRFIDPEYPDLKLYYTADSATGAPLLGLYAYYGSSETLNVPDFIQAVYDSPLAYNTPLKFIYLPENLIEFFSLGNSSAVFYVDKDSATAKLMVNAAGAYPSKRFADPSMPDFVLYYTADSSSGSLQLSLYKYLAADDESITIPSGVTHIYDYAFDLQDASQNTVLKEVRLPDSVVSIGSFAFPAYALPSLEAVYLSDNISAWGSYPFASHNSLRLYCSLSSTTFRTMTLDLTPLGVIDPDDPDFAWQNDGSGGRVLTGYYGSEPHVTIPEGTTAIGKNAFYGNTALTTVTFPSSLKTIGDSAFENNFSLTAAVLPDGLTHIGVNAFYNAKKLSNIVIPDYVHIGTYAFEYQDYWTDQDEIAKRTVYLADNVTFDNYPFNTHATFMVNAGSNTAKEFERLNDEWGWGALYTFIDPRYPDHLIGQYGGEVYFVGYCGSGSTITVPPFCTAIAFNIYEKTPNHTNILSVIVSEGVTRIEDSAFDGGWNFSILSLPSTLRYIGSKAFFATGVRTMIIPEGVTEVGEVVTDSYLKNLVLPASLTTIPQNAFARNKEKLTNVDTIYCYKNTPAAAWAEARPYQKIKYIDDTGYSFVFPERASSEYPEEPHAYIGSGYDWRSNMQIFPAEPDMPYTLHIASANPNIVSVQNDELILHAPGKAKLTVTSPELGVSGSFNLTVYAPLEDFSIPEYIFTKVGTTKLTISAADLVPAAGTDPIFHWRLHRQDGGYYMTQSVFTLDSHTLPASPEVLGITATPRNSALTHSGKLVVYSKVDSAVFDSFTGLLAAGMTVRPNISVTVDGIVYESTIGTYTLASSKPEIAKPTADGGLELLAPGTATITATFLNGKTAKQTITVTGEKVYTIAGGVTAIEAEAFFACPVTIAIIPDGCESIGARAFADCAQLKEITIPQSVTFIEDDAFAGCAQLTIRAAAGSYAQRFAQEHDIPLAAD